MFEEKVVGLWAFNECKTTVAQDVRVSALEHESEVLEKYGAGFVVEDGKLYLVQEKG